MLTCSQADQFHEWIGKKNAVQVDGNLNHNEWVEADSMGTTFVNQPTRIVKS